MKQAHGGADRRRSTRRRRRCTSSGERRRRGGRRRRGRPAGRTSAAPSGRRHRRGDVIDAEVVDVIDAEVVDEGRSSSRRSPSHDRESESMDFYVILGLERGGDVGGHQAGVQAARAAVPSGHQSGRPDGGGAVPADRRGLRDADRSRSAAALRRGRRPAAPPARPRRSVSRGSISRSAAHGAQAATFGDLFADVLHPRDAGDAGRAGARAPICTRRSTLAFEDAMRGGERQVVVTRQERAATCSGAGQRADAGRALCRTCHGTGSVRSARGHMVFSKPCARCGGTGRQRSAALRGLRRAAAGSAHRSGRRARARRAWPTARGSACRARDTPGATAGETAILRHRARRSRTRCSGARATICTSSCRSAVHEAALGARIDVPTLDGPVAAARAAGHAVGPAVPAARARRAGARRAAAAIWSSKCSSCCRSCSTSGRRSCCGSSARRQRRRTSGTRSRTSNLRSRP